VDPVDESFVRELERRRLGALVQGDLDVARDLHADDYELITPGAARLSKEAYLAGIESGQLDYVVFEPAGEIRVQMLGEAAAVRYRARIDVRFENGGRDAGLFWHTDIYAYRGGHWRAVWSQATRIPSA
jgi:hypothetical protein